MKGRCPGSSFLALAVSVLTVTGVASLRGRPLLRLGEMGGLLSWRGTAGRRGGTCSGLGSAALGGVLGGLPRFRLTGTAGSAGPSLPG